MPNSTVYQQAQMRAKLASGTIVNEPQEAIISPKLARSALWVSAGVLIVTLVLFWAANLFGDNLSRGGHSISKEKIEFRIGVDSLGVPANTIRFDDQRKPGSADRLELYLHWPSLSGYTENLRQEFNQGVENANIVFLSLERRKMRYDMSGRVEPIYSRFFVGNSRVKPYGLIQQPLSKEAGFLDEDLFVETASPYPYAARCVRENSRIAKPFCIRDINVGKDLMVTYRFHKRFLPQWIELDQAVRAYVKSLITNL